MTPGRQLHAAAYSEKTQFGKPDVVQTGRWTCLSILGLDVDFTQPIHQMACQLVDSLGSSNLLVDDAGLGNVSNWSMHVQ